MTTITGLVADYGSSDSEVDDHENHTLKDVKKGLNYFEITLDDDAKQSQKPPKKKKKVKNILANPLRSSSASKKFLEPSSSVFYNPFQKEQEAKKSVLEKHVKLTNNPKDVVEINGKKICWNYRKGRCKFGHKCKYAHDSDLIVNSTTSDNNHKKQNSLASEMYIPTGEVSFESERTNDRKRKPGLSEGLIPNKRSRNMHKEIQSKETPWLIKR